MANPMSHNSLTTTALAVFWRIYITCELSALYFVLRLLKLLRV